MNSASSGKTFIKMQNQLLKDDDCACFLVEAISKQSQNIKWEPKVDGEKVGHKFIRRVSLDQFYFMVTGEKDAFYKMCMNLPSVAEKAVEKMGTEIVPNDTVFEEIIMKAEGNIEDDSELAVARVIYLLGFSTYLGFDRT